MLYAQRSRKWKQNTLKEGLVQERSSNAVKPANSFTEVTGPIAMCNELAPQVIIRDGGWNYRPA